ncbi:unnamed protein product [Absidia cylindrospora]
MTSKTNELQQQQQSSTSSNTTISSKLNSRSVMTDEKYTLLRKCTQALNYLLSFEISGPFIMAVPKTYQLYYKKIKYPMDLTSLERNLYSRKYTTYQQFEAQLSLVWQNAMEYHQRHTLIYKKASMLQQLYEKLKQDIDQSLRSVTSKPVELLSPNIQPIQSISEKSDFYIIAAISPQESPMMVQRYENFAYARPIYDELHGPLFHQLLKNPPDHQQETEPYPRLYISRNRTHLINALEKQASKTIAILWNTRFDATPAHSIKPQNRNDLLIITTHVTHGIPYCDSHNAVRSPSSYLVSTPSGFATTNESDYAPQAWIKFKPTSTFYDVKMVISKRMENAFFCRAYEIQPVSVKVQRPVFHPPKEPWLNNTVDQLLIQRMKQCLNSGKSDVSILNQQHVSSPSTTATTAQQTGYDDQPIVISDESDDDFFELDAAPTVTIPTTTTETSALEKDSNNDTALTIPMATTTTTTTTEFEAPTNDSNTLLDLMNEMREFAHSKDVKMVNVNDYTANATLRVGGEGRFKLVRYVAGNKKLAIVTFRRMTATQCVNEIISLLKLKGLEGMANIVEVLYENGNESKVVGLTMERYQHTLKQHIQAHTHQRLTPCQKMDLIRQMLKCVQCIHENGIAHRDLSEANFMVDDSTTRLADGSIGAQVRLIDFNKAVFMTSRDVRRWWVGPPPSDDDAATYGYDNTTTDDELIPKTQAELDEWCDLLPLMSTYPDHGHRCYRSIQTLPRTQKDRAKLPWYIDPAAEDMYSVAVLIWRVFTDKEPWNGVLEDNLIDLQDMVKKDVAIELQVERGVSGDLSQLFLLKCIRANPGDRLSAKELLAWLDTPLITPGLMDEWTTYYSSTTARSRRTAAAAAVSRLQGDRTHSRLADVLEKTSQQAIQARKRHRNVEHTKQISGKRKQKQSSITESSLLPPTVGAAAEPAPSRIQPDSTIQSPPSTPIVKTRAQTRRVNESRSTSPHSTLKPSSSLSQHAVSTPSSPNPTVHTSSTSFFSSSFDDTSKQPSPYSPSSSTSEPVPPDDDDHQQHSDSSFFSTNIAKNPYLFLISYPPSNVRAQKQIRSTSQPAPLPFTQQCLNWMYDSKSNLKLPSLGLTMGPSSSSSSSSVTTIYDESDTADLTAEIDSNARRSFSPPSTSRPLHETMNPRLGDDDRPSSASASTGSKKRKTPSSPRDDDHDMDARRKPKDVVDDRTIPYDDDDDDEDEEDDDDDDDDVSFDDSDSEFSSNNDDDDAIPLQQPQSPPAPSAFHGIKKRGRPPGSKSRKGSKRLGRPPGSVFQPPAILQLSSSRHSKKRNKSGKY